MPLRSAEVFGDSAGFHALIETCSLAKTKKAGMPFDSLNEVVSLNSWPVGAPSGILTTSGTADAGAPSMPPVYSVDTSAPLSETHNGVDGPKESPQALTRFGSMSLALPA